MQAACSFLTNCQMSRESRDQNPFLPGQGSRLEDSHTVALWGKARGMEGGVT